MRFIEILIALILVYAILSILVSVLAEWWSSRKKKRGNMLRQAIFQMLNDPLNLSYGQLLLNHPLVSSMNNKSENRPAQYLDSGIFADALIDVIAQQADTGIPIGQTIKTSTSSMLNKKTIDQFELGLKEMNNSSFKRMLSSMLMKSDRNYKKLKKSIEKWFDSNMDRATGWYKRNQKTSLKWFALIVVLFLNVDSIHIFRVISMDENLRNKLVTVAEGVTEKYKSFDSIQKEEMDNQLSTINASLGRIDSLTPDNQNKETISNCINSFNKMSEQLRLTDSTSKKHMEQANTIVDISSQLGLPIGWSCDIAPASWIFCDSIQAKIPNNKLGKYLYERNHNPSFLGVCFWIIGIIISTIMLSQGATFWFELLVKFVNIRKAGIKPLNKTK